MIPFAVVRMEGEREEPLIKPWPTTVRAVSKQIASMRQELRLGLPVFTKEDIRRYRMYDVDSVMLELLDAGEEWAAHSFWQLLKLDESTRANVSADPVAFQALRRPPLSRKLQLMHALATGLCAASAANRAGDKGAMGAELLSLAENAWARKLPWWWLTERLLVMAVEATRGWRRDGGLSEASVALAYGSFLLYQMHVGEEALEHLTLAAQLSKGKPWLAAPSLLKLLPKGAWAEQEETPEPEGSDVRAEEVAQLLSLVASAVLAEALIQEARRAGCGRDGQEGDHGRAAAYCREAVQHANNAHLLKLERDAQRELGMSLLSGGQAQPALDAFNVFLKQAESAGSEHDIVNAHLKLALCYHRLHNNEGVKEELERARIKAEKAGLVNLLAKAHLHTGEFYLNTTRPHYATAHFTQAFCRHSDLKHNDQADEARIMAGIAGGLELLPEFARAVRESAADGSPGSREKARERVLQLLAWKDTHQTFWPSDMRVSRPIRELYWADPRPPAPSTITLNLLSMEDEDEERKDEESDDEERGDDERDDDRKEEEEKEETEGKGEGEERADQSDWDSDEEKPFTQ